MKLTRYPIFGIIALAMAVVSRWTLAVVDAVDRAVAFVFDVLATKPHALAGNGGFTGLLVGRPSYDAPPQHELRHEAGTSRRAAARNI